MFQVIDGQNFANLYHFLLYDCSVVVLVKIMLNHNIEFALEMQGTLSVSACYAMTLSAQALDFLLYSYMFYVSLTRYCYKKIQYTRNYILLSKTHCIFRYLFVNVWKNLGNCSDMLFRMAIMIQGLTFSLCKYILLINTCSYIL